MSNADVLASTPLVMRRPLSRVANAWLGAAASADTVLRHQSLLESARSTRARIAKASSTMLESSRNIVNITLSGRLSAQRVSKAGDLALLTQQISSQSGQFLTPFSGQFGEPGNLPALIGSLEPIMAENAANYSRAAVEVQDIRQQIAGFAKPLDQLLKNAPVLKMVEQSQVGLPDC